MPERTPDLGLPPAPLPQPNDASAEAEVRLRADTVWTRATASPGAAPGILRVSRQQLRGPSGRVAIVEACRRLAGDAAAREDLAARGYACVTRRDFTAALAAALAAESVFH